MTNCFFLFYLQDFFFSLSTSNNNFQYHDILTDWDHRANHPSSLFSLYMTAISLFNIFSLYFLCSQGYFLNIYIYTHLSKLVIESKLIYIPTPFMTLENFHFLIFEKCYDLFLPFSFFLLIETFFLNNFYWECNFFSLIKQLILHVMIKLFCEGCQEKLFLFDFSLNYRENFDFFPDPWRIFWFALKLMRYLKKLNLKLNLNLIYI